MAVLGEWLLVVQISPFEETLTEIIGFITIVSMFLIFILSKIDKILLDTIDKKLSKGDFKTSLLVMIAATMKVDGKISTFEFYEVQAFLRANFEKEAFEMLQNLKKIIKKSIDYRQVASQINMNYSAKLQLLHLLFKVSKADGMISNSSFVFLQEIAQLMSVSDADFNSLKAIYFFSSQHRGYSNNSSTQHSVSLAYDILEIMKTADEKEIKKAYRRMAMKYHPDKVGNLGEEVKKTAEEKFKVVNAAYETLKKEKGFV